MNGNMAFSLLLFPMIFIAGATLGWSEKNGKNWIKPITLGVLAVLCAIGAAQALELL